MTQKQAGCISSGLFRSIFNWQLNTKELLGSFNKWDRMMNYIFFFYVILNDFARIAFKQK